MLLTHTHIHMCNIYTTLANEAEELHPYNRPITGMQPIDCQQVCNRPTTHASSAHARTHTSSRSVAAAARSQLLGRQLARAHSNKLQERTQAQALRARTG